jgi:hypothetical protein
MEFFESRASSRATEKNQSDLDREVPPPAPCVSESPSDTESFDLIPVRRPDDTSNARQLTEFLAWTRANQHARQLESICQSEDAADKMHEAQEEYKCLKSFSRALRRLTDRQTFFARYYGWAWDTVLKDDIVSRTTRLDSVVDSIWGDDFRKPSESQGGPAKRFRARRTPVRWLRTRQGRARRVRAGRVRTRRVRARRVETRIRRRGRRKVQTRAQRPRRVLTTRPRRTRSDFRARSMVQYKYRYIQYVCILYWLETRPTSRPRDTVWWSIDVEPELDGFIFAIVLKPLSALCPGRTTTCWAVASAPIRTETRSLCCVQ